MCLVENGLEVPVYRPQLEATRLEEVPKAYDCETEKDSPQETVLKGQAEQKSWQEEEEWQRLILKNETCGRQPWDCRCLQTSSP